MQIELLVTPNCAPCRKAEAVWREVCEKEGLSLVVRDTARGEAQDVSRRHRLNTFPGPVSSGGLTSPEHSKLHLDFNQGEIPCFTRGDHKIFGVAFI